MSAERTTIKVVVRARPYNPRENGQRQRQIVKVLDKTTLLFDPDEGDDAFFFQGMKQNFRDFSKRVNKKISMEFDRVFDSDSTNEEIFQECTSPLVTSVLNGYNCSVFVYGATGAGKTFTMLGNNTYPGLTILTMHDLFQKMEAQKNTHMFEVAVSYVEIYNELVKNLLKKTGPLKLREHGSGVMVSGLDLTPIYNADELFRLLIQGNSNRTQHPTDANAESSRSHAVFQVHVRITDRKSGSNRTVKLSMIDLAGSERAASTKGVGDRFKEGASINKSLLALGNCINNLADGLKHIPYRDSNLTRLLKDSLGGNCQTLMVANVSMSSLTYEDTYNTLKYASRAKKIRTTLRQNAMKSNMPKEYYVNKVVTLMTELERMKEHIRTLESKCSQCKCTSATCLYDEGELTAWYSKIDAVYASVLMAQKYVIANESKIKNLNFRLKLKEETNLIRNILALKEKEEEERATAANSTSILNEEVEKLKGESLPWRKKLDDAHKDLKKLTKEIQESKYASILQIYQSRKDLEIRSSKQSINVDHISSINSEFVRHSAQSRKSFTVACHILKNCYSNMDVGMQRKVEQLQQYLSSLTLTPKDEYKNANDEDIEVLDINELQNGKPAHYKSETEYILPKCTRKRQREKRDYELNMNDDGTDSDECTIFKKPFPLRNNLEETQVLSLAKYDKNRTTDVGDLKPKMDIQQASNTEHKTELVANTLSEKTPPLPLNKHPPLNAVLKSNNHGLLNSVAVGKQTANKIHIPPQIVKSPGSPRVKAIAKANLARRQPPCIVKSNREPIVRINRAAYFRTKK